VTFAATASLSRRERSGGGTSGYNSYSLSTDLQVAVSAAAAVTLNYLYYRFQLPAGYTLPTGVGSELDRHRLQVGARFWLPFFRAGRGYTPQSGGQQRGG